jgi:hypothetical protein
MLRFHEDAEDGLKHVGVLMTYNIINIHICCAFVGLDNNLYIMHGTYIKIMENVYYFEFADHSIPQAQAV